MARKKGETSKVYNSDLDNEYSYSDLTKAFNDKEDCSPKRNYYNT